jgi:chemotaxis protein CheD
MEKLPDAPELPKVVLHPGERHASAKPVQITTLLGSCVAACLYDPTTGVAGMNHFLLANKRYSKDMPVSITEAGRYGVNAMELLINEMLHLGAQKKAIRAKVFGGGAVLGSVSHENFMCVGNVNERFIREFLKNENIRIEAEDLGGEQGRVIRFRTDTFAVYRRFVQKTQTFLVEKKELGYWKKSIEEHRKKEEQESKTDIFLFK